MVSNRSTLFEDTSVLIFKRSKLLNYELLKLLNRNRFLVGKDALTVVTRAIKIQRANNVSLGRVFLHLSM